MAITLPVRSGTNTGQILSSDHSWGSHTDSGGNSTPYNSLQDGVEGQLAAALPLWITDAALQPPPMGGVNLGWAALNPLYYTPGANIQTVSQAWYAGQQAANGNTGTTGWTLTYTGQIGAKTFGETFYSDVWYRHYEFDADSMWRRDYYNGDPDNGGALITTEIGTNSGPDTAWETGTGRAHEATTPTPADEADGDMPAAADVITYEVIELTPAERALLARHEMEAAEEAYGNAAKRLAKTQFGTQAYEDALQAKTEADAERKAAVDNWKEAQKAYNEQREKEIGKALESQPANFDPTRLSTPALNQLVDSGQASSERRSIYGTMHRVTVIPVTLEDGRQVKLVYLNDGIGHKIAAVLPGSYSEQQAANFVWSQIREHANNSADATTTAVLSLIPGFGTVDRAAELANGRASWTEFGKALSLDLIQIGRYLKFCRMTRVGATGFVGLKGADMYNHLRQGAVGSAMLDVLEASLAVLNISCFPAGTLVVAVDQHGERCSRAIESICIGDVVLARAEHGTEVQWRRVIDTVQRSKESLWHITYCRDGSPVEHTIRATDEHPFWSARRQDWVQARDLKPGDTLADPRGETWVVIRTHREAFAEPIPVYNLTVEHDHTYFVAPPNDEHAAVLVHNVKCKTGGLATPKDLASRVWPKHHPFPVYLGGAIDQTLKKIPRGLHYQFHASLDKWMGGKYARAKTAAAFKSMDKSEIIRDLTIFYKTADGGAYRKYLADFLKAVEESGL